MPVNINNNHTLNPNICFPLPRVLGDDTDYDGHQTIAPTTTGTCPNPPAILTAASAPLFASSLSTLSSPKLQGKAQKSAVNGYLSIANILSNAFQLPGFPRTAYAISHSGKLGLTFLQIDLISKRLALVISSLVLLPGSDSQVRTNNDGDSVVMIILDDEEYVDEQFIVLIFAILRLGATYMVVSRDQVSSDQKYWKQLVSLMNPILVVTKGDPIDLPTAIKNDLNLFARENFDDYQTEDDDSPGDIGPQQLKSNYDSDQGSTTDLNPFHASTLLVKKIRSSIILQPNTYLGSPTVSCRVLWDLAVEMNIPNEKDLLILHFRSEIQAGQRAAFIFQCTCSSPHSGIVEQWCKLGHKAIRNRISWERIEIPIKVNEKLCLTFPLSDPRSLVQIFNCLIHGKALILGEPGEFHSGPFLLRRLGTDVFKNVQRMELTPDRLQSLLDCAIQPRQEYNLSRIKVWVISTSSASPFSPSLAKTFFQKVKSNDVMLVVTYGTPECLWCASWNMFSSSREMNKCVTQEKYGETKLFNGESTMNSTVLVVDSRKSTICPVGQKGEIYLMGSMVPTLGYCGSTILGKSISIFETGDMGRFVQDKGGNIQLVLENDISGTDTKRKLMVEGKLVNLDELGKQVKQNSIYVREAFAFICQRGRDTPEVVVALALKDQAKFDIAQEVTLQKFTGFAGSLALRCFSVIPPTIPKKIPAASEGKGDNNSSIGGPVDLKKVRAAYFKHLGKSNPNDWQVLFPAKGPGGRYKNPSEEAIEKSIKVICKAVAFSLGLSLGDVIENFDKSFWDMGGSPIRAVLTVKSCLCQGKKLAVEDFMIVAKISELGFRLVYAERNETKWFHEIEVAGKFVMCSLLTRSDHLEIQDILLNNFCKLLPMAEHKVIEKYCTGLIETFDNALSAVALLSETREILGIAFNYKGNLKPHFVPPNLEEGLELYNIMIQSCQHLMNGSESRHIAKCYMICLKTEALVHPSQVLLVVRDLVKESLTYAECGGCKGYLVCSMDPLVQEVCCSLLGFEKLSEIQLNLYRNKKYQKPFAHLDDHQVFGVYFANLNP